MFISTAYGSDAGNTANSSYFEKEMIPYICSDAYKCAAGSSVADFIKDVITGADIIWFDDAQAVDGNQYHHCKITPKADGEPQTVTILYANKWRDQGLGAQQGLIGRIFLFPNQSISETKQSVIAADKSMRRTKASLLNPARMALMDQALFGRSSPSTAASQPSGRPVPVTL